MTKAFETARTAHSQQTRKSGEGYINHPLAVAKIVADIGLDETTVIAALLHDAVEDTVDMGQGRAFGDHHRMHADIQPLARQRVFDLGAAAFVAKPVTAQAVLNALHVIGVL